MYPGIVATDLTICNLTQRAPRLLARLGNLSTLKFSPLMRWTLPTTPGVEAYSVHPGIVATDLFFFGMPAWSRPNPGRDCLVWP